MIATLLAVPLLGAGLSGLWIFLQPEGKGEPARMALLERVPEAARKAADPATVLLASAPGCGAALGLALVLVGFACWPSGGGSSRKKASRGKANKGQNRAARAVADTAPPAETASAPAVSRRV